MMLVSLQALVFFPFIEMHVGIFLLFHPLCYSQNPHTSAQEISHVAVLGVVKPYFGI